MTIFFAEVAAFYIAYYTIIMAGYIYIHAHTRLHGVPAVLQAPCVGLKGEGLLCPSNNSDVK